MVNSLHFASQSLALDLNKNSSNARAVNISDVTNMISTAAKWSM